MKMPTLIPGREHEEDPLNPGDKNYRQSFGDDSLQSKDVNQSDIERGLSEAENYANDPKNRTDTSDVRGQEEQSDYRSTYGQNRQPNKTTGRIKSFFKKAGPSLGIGGGLGIGGIILAGFMGVVTMPISLMENMSFTNDSTSTAMERRVMKALGFQTNKDTVECTGTKIKCSMGRISNNALRKLEKKGIKPIYPDGTTNTDKRTGYPSKNPSSYEIDMGNGKTETVPRQNLVKFMQDNPKVASKVLGTKGAFNFAVKAWAGNYLNKKVLGPLGLKKDGGIADGKNEDTDKKNRFNKALEKAYARMPGSEKINTVADGIKGKVESQLERSKRGGVGYTVAVASCMSLKAPALVAAGVAAVQLAQILPIVNDVILSPGSKIKASGVNISDNITAADAEAVGTVLTEKTPRADGKMTSALDSRYLQSALGVNTSKNPVSQKFTPGFSVFGLLSAGIAAEKTTAPACNAILSPAAMYSAMAVDAAVTIAASSTIFGGLIKIAASAIIGHVAIEIVKAVAEGAAVEALTQLAKNTDIETAKGEEFGDILGIAGAGFFSAGGMARNLPTLTTEQLGEFAQVKQENESFNREIAIASLSPFDVTSRYTFLGSIAHNLNTNALANDMNAKNVFGVMRNIFSTSISGLNGTVHADAKGIESYCGYAEDFGMEGNEEEGIPTPAINMTGMPCTGITTGQARISTEDAINLIANEGWLDESKSIADNATIIDLIETGYIKPDTPLSDFINDCSNPTSGDYLFNAGACTVKSEARDLSSEDAKKLTSGCVAGDDEEANKACSDEFSNVGEGMDLKDPRSLEAMSVFLLDFQIIQSINGEDEVVGGSSPAGAAGETFNPDDLFKDSTNIACAAGTTDAGMDTGYNGGPQNSFPVRLCSIPGTIEGGKEIRVSSVVSGAVNAMITAMRADLGVDVIKAADSYRTKEGQEHAYRCWTGNAHAGEDCSDIAGKAAAPGHSMHQSGNAIDFQLPTGNSGSSRPGDTYWEWLTANAGKFGYKQYSGESWHWSATGG